MTTDDPTRSRFPFRGLPDDLDAGSPAPAPEPRSASPEPPDDRRWKAWEERVEAEMRRVQGEARGLLAEIARWKEEVVREVAGLRQRWEGSVEEGEAATRRLVTREAEARGAIDAITRTARGAIADAEGRFRALEERVRGESAAWFTRLEEMARAASAERTVPEAVESPEQEGFRTHLDRVLARRVLPALESARKRTDDLEESLRGARREVREAIGAQAASIEDLRQALERRLRTAEEALQAGAEAARQASAAEGARAIQAARTEVDRLRAEVRGLQGAIASAGERRIHSLVVTIVVAVIAAAIVAGIVAAF